jgi:predicted ATPase with chaperone activity
VDRIKVDKAVEVIGQSGTLSFKMRVTDHGRHRASEALKASGYLGPAPVSIEAYTKVLERQLGHLPPVSRERVAEVVDDLVLPPHVVEIAGLARSSGRSLFLWGPPGNGKTSVGHLIHSAVEGHLWIPYCISVGGAIIKFYDPQCHELADDEPPADQRGPFDRRWVLIQRPFVVVGGELTVEALDLALHPILRYYEAPLHLKANGGTFLIDDFGCQRSEPQELLNRWVLPLERHIDYLTLRTGRQVPVPFKQMLILSTNLDPEKVMDAAFLRRMGYRLYLGYVSREQYETIFKRYAAKRGLEVSVGLLENLFEWYRNEERPLRGCEPRDLIERARDICAYRGLSPQLNDEIIETAWRGYFGERGPAR